MIKFIKCFTSSSSVEEKQLKTKTAQFIQAENGSKAPYMICKYRKKLKNFITKIDTKNSVTKKPRIHKVKIKEKIKSYESKDEYDFIILNRSSGNRNNKSTKQIVNTNLRLQKINCSFLSEVSENNTFNSMVNEVNNKYKLPRTTNNNNFDQDNVKNDNNPEKTNVNKEEVKKQIFEEMRRKEEKRLERRMIDEEEKRLMEIERQEERKRIKESDDKYSEHKQKELTNAKICMETLIKLNKQSEIEASSKRDASRSKHIQTAPTKKYLTPATKPTYKSKLKEDAKKETKPIQTTPKNKNTNKENLSKSKPPIYHGKIPEKKPVEKKPLNKIDKSKIASGDKSKPEPKIIKSQPIKKREIKGKTAKPQKPVDNKSKNKIQNKSKTGTPAPTKKTVNGKNNVKNNKSKLSELQNRDVSSKEQDISNTETFEVEKVRHESTVKQSSVKPKKNGCCGKSNVKPSIETELVMVDPISNEKAEEGDGIAKGPLNEEPDRRSIKPV